VPGFAPPLPVLKSTASTLATNKLGVPAIVIFVWCAATPLTVVAGIVTTGFAQTGMIGMPLAFPAVGAVLMLFAVGFVAMARRIGTVGGLYAFLAKGLGRAAGVGGAWMALVAYNGLQVGLYGAVGAAAAPLLDRALGVSVPWWVTALVCCAFVAWQGVMKVDQNRTVLAVLLLAEVSVLSAFSIADLVVRPADGHVSTYALSLGNVVTAGIGASLALAFLGFVGFEAAIVFSSEAKDPARTIPRAMRWSIALIAVLYAFSSWAMTVAVGAGNIVVQAREHSVDLIFILAGDRLGRTAADVGQVLFFTSVIAALLAFHFATARYGYALGLERVLPGWLGRTSRRSSAPHHASMAQSLLAVAVILTYAVLHWDPVVYLFYWGGAIGAVGVLLLLDLTSFAVIGYFGRHLDERRTAGRWRTQVAPLASSGLLIAVTVLVLLNVPTLLGVAPGHPMVWIVRLGFPALFVLGTGFGLYLKARHWDVYCKIGLAARAATTPALPAPRTAAHSTSSARQQAGRS
jgi:amino acid transporter